MSMVFNIYMVGVGGQGIGLLAELLARAADYAGQDVRACDTHGLAQRGGMVTSHLRLGPCYSPLVPEAQAHLVIALERHEALRAAGRMLAPSGSLIWYDACLQPLDVRMGKAAECKATDIEAEVSRQSGKSFRVYRVDLPDSRMQNIAIISDILKHGLVPGIAASHVLKAMADLMDQKSLEANSSLL